MRKWGDQTRSRKAGSAKRFGQGRPARDPIETKNHNKQPSSECLDLDQWSAPTANVRFGSKADIGACPRNLRFTPADIETQSRDVRYVPADIGVITSSDRW